MKYIKYLLYSLLFIAVPVFATTFIVPQGGTGAGTLPQLLLQGNNTGAISGTSTPTFASFVATSTIATSTAANGINLSNGCFAINSTCLVSGILSLNGLTNLNQIFATSTSGDDFDITSSGTTHTFNLPDASSVARGVVTIGDQTFGGVKTFTGLITNNSTTTGIAYINTLGVASTTPWKTLSIGGANTIGNDIAIGTSTIIYSGINKLIHTSGGPGGFSGISNFFAGQSSGGQITTGDGNVGVGVNTLIFNTIGDSNSAFGGNALSGNTTGSLNSAFGDNALSNNSSGLNNTSIGSLSLLLSNGNYNSALGMNAGRSITTGSNNTFLGYQAGYTDGTITTTNVSNSTAIGYNAQVTADSSLILGGTGAFAVNVGIGTTSPSALLSVNGVAIIGNSSLLAGNATTTIYGDVRHVGRTIVSGDIIPSASSTYNLGSAAFPFKSLYVSSSTMYIGDTPLSNDNGNLSWNGTTVVGGTSIQYLNGLSTSSQALATSSSGNDFDITSSDFTHTFNLPDASPTARGVVTINDQVFGGLKSFGNILITGSSTLQDFTGINATTTNFYSTTASSTNLFTTAMVSDSHTTGSLNVTGNATSTFNGGLDITSGCFSINGVCVGSGGGGGGITSLNALTDSSQSFATDSSGSDFNISSSGGIHTFSLPDASISARGLVNNSTQTFAGTKTFGDLNATGNTSLQTITSGTWNGSIISPTYGGTGVSSFGGTNTLLFTTSADTLSSLATTNNATLVTNGDGVPMISSTLPSTVQQNITLVGTLTSGVWNGTAIDVAYGGTGNSSPAYGQMLIGNASNGYTLSATSTLKIDLADTTGTISIAQGSTGISSPSAAGILLGSYAGDNWQQLATSTLGLLTSDVAEGSNLYFTDIRADARITAATSIGALISGSIASGFGTISTANTITTTALGTFGTLLSNGSSTFQNFTALNSTTTNATSTNGYATTASSTNLYGTSMSMQKFTIASANGNIGVGSTTPWKALSVGGQGTNGFDIGFGTSTIIYSGDSKFLHTQGGTVGSNKGIVNVYLGQSAGNAITTGTNSVGIGLNALKVHTTGQKNTAVGANALALNTTTGSNTAVGESALNANTANDNTAVGMSALLQNTSGTPNDAFGESALQSITTTAGNTSFGFSSFSSLTGSNSAAFGNNAGRNITSGSNDTFLGYRAGYTDGVTATTNVSNSTAIGYFAQVRANSSLVLGGTGSYSVKAGVGTTTPSWLFQIASTSASSATMNGQLALTDMGASANNKHWVLSSNSGSLFITTATDALATSTTAAFRMNNAGNLFLPSLTQSGSNQTYYACGAATTFEMMWDTTTCLVSALKYKKNVKNIDVGLSELLKLRPVTYYKKEPLNKTDAGQQVGFIADEVIKIDPRLVTLDSKGEVHGFRYEQFTAVITKSIQEFYTKFQGLVARVSGLENRVKAQQKQIDEQKIRLDNLEKRLNSLEI